MITFSSSINIARPPEAVFDFLANVHLMQQAEGSPVLALDMTTPRSSQAGIQVSRSRAIAAILQRGVHQLMEPFMRKPLFTRLEARLSGIKSKLEEYH